MSVEPILKNVSSPMFRVLHFNITNPVKKVNEIILVANRENLDLVCFGEHWPISVIEFGGL